MKEREGNHKEEGEGALKRFIRTAVLKKRWNRTEIYTSVCLYMTILGWGLFWGAQSTILLDLELLTKTSTTQIGLTFTFCMLGSLVGAPVGGLILSKVNSLLYMAVISVVCGFTMPSLPWARSFFGLIILSTINGVCCGALDSGLNITTLVIWGWDGTVFMQAFHCLFGVGNFIGPWLTKSFLAKVISNNLNSTTNTNFKNSTINLTKQNVSLTEYGESTVMYPFIIIGMYQIATGIAYLITYFITRKESDEEMSEAKDNGHDKDKGAETSSQNLNQKQLWYMLPMVFMAFLRFMTYVGLEVTFSSFLMTFAVKSLNWDKTKGLLATTIYYGSFACSRILAIFLAMVVSPTNMTICNTVLMLIAFIVLASCVHLHPMVLLVTSAAVGISQASFYGSSMSWASKYIRVSRKVGTVFTTGSWVGGSALPALAGHIIDSASANGFLYLCLGDVILLAMVVTISTLMGLRYGNPDDDCKSREQMKKEKLLEPLKPNEGNEELIELNESIY